MGSPCSHLQKFFWLVHSIQGSCPLLCLPLLPTLSAWDVLPNTSGRPVRVCDLLWKPPLALAQPRGSTPLWQHSKSWGRLHRAQGTQACLGLAHSPAPPCPRFILLELSSHLSRVLLVAWGQAVWGRTLRSRGKGTTYRDSRLGRGRDEATAWCHLQAPACLGRHALVPFLTLSACSPGTSSLFRLWALLSWDQAWHSLFPPAHSGPDSSSLAHSLSLGVLV